jgi:hypothetical protein
VNKVAPSPFAMAPQEDEFSIERNRFRAFGMQDSPFQHIEAQEPRTCPAKPSGSRGLIKGRRLFADKENSNPGTPVDEKDIMTQLPSFL